MHCHYQMVSQWISSGVSREWAPPPRFLLLCVAIAFPNPDERNPHQTPFQLGSLAHSFPPSRARSIAFATFAAGAPVGGAFGNIIGGVLIQLSQYVRSFYEPNIP